jgi:hypothetical protein
MLRRIEDETNLDRGEALREVLRRYIAGMHSNEPVHRWPADG